MRPSSTRSPPTSRGPRGRRSPTAPARTTRTRTTGPTSRGRQPPDGSTYLWSAMSLITLLGGIGTILFCIRQLRLPRLAAATDAAGHRRPRVSPLEADAEPAGHGQVLRRRGGAFPAAGACRRRPRALPRRARRLLRLRSRAVAALQPARTWHLQLAIFWIATAWVAGGLFLAPLVGGAEPQGERCARLLLGALASSCSAASSANSLGINGRLGEPLVLARAPGLGVPRPRALLAAAARGGPRALALPHVPRAAAGDEAAGRADLASLFLYSAVGDPVFYLPALFYGPHTNFAVIDNWRFWIIHLWVEGFFELFATVLVAAMFHQMGLVPRRRRRASSISTPSCTSAPASSARGTTGTSRGRAR